MEKIIDENGYDVHIWHHKDGRREYWLIKAWLEKEYQPESEDFCVWDFSIYSACIKEARRIFPEQYHVYENIKFVINNQINLLEKR